MINLKNLKYYKYILFILINFWTMKLSTFWNNLIHNNLKFIIINLKSLKLKVKSLDLFTVTLYLMNIFDFNYRYTDSK